MTRRAAPLMLVLLFAACLFAQRNPLEPMRPDGDQGSVTELVVHITYASEKHAGEHITVMLESAHGGMIAETFTNNEGKALFQGVRPGAYVIRVRGLKIKEVVTSILNIESFEKSHHEYIRTQPSDLPQASESSQGTVSATELQIPENARKEFDKGNEALARGDRANAIEHLQKATSLYPKFVMAYNNLAAAYMKTRDFKHAREALEQALEADPDLSFTKANRVRLALLEHNYADAVPLIENVLAKEPKNPEFLFLMCEAQFFYGRYEETVTYARKVYSTSHEKFELAHILAGRALEALNRPAEARAEYNALIQETPWATEVAEARRSLARLGNAPQGQ